MRTAGYLALMVMITAAALFRLRRARSLGDRRVVVEALLLLVVVLVAAEVAAFAFAPTRDADDHLFFMHVRLLAYGLFGAVPIYLAGAALLLRQRMRALAWASAAAAAAAWVIAVDAFLIEPHWLEVHRVRLESSKVTRPVTIVVLADIQTDEPGEWEAGVLARAIAENPDLVLLPGDYVHVEGDPPRWDLQASRLRGLLQESRLAGRLGTFAVQGNVDPAGWERIFLGTGIVATSERVRMELEEVSVTALSFGDSFDASLRLPRDEERFQIVFGHGPDFALGDVPADLLVAGHTHGGQVQLPWIGPLVKLSRVPRAWASGVTSLPGGRTLVVSRGIGMERGNAPRLRFLCRPELVVIRVEPRVAR